MADREGPFVYDDDGGVYTYPCYEFEIGYTYAEQGGCTLSESCSNVSCT